MDATVGRALTRGRLARACRAPSSGHRRLADFSLKHLLHQPGTIAGYYVTMSVV